MGYFLAALIVFACVFVVWVFARDAAKRKREAAFQAVEAEAAEAIKVMCKDTIEAFFNVAERKVSVLDEYGDENWDALANEIRRCLLKISNRLGVKEADLAAGLQAAVAEQEAAAQGREPVKNRWFILGEYLGDEFGRRHVLLVKRGRYGQDCSSMTGKEFETYVANVLKSMGFSSVRGTPATGDQGADLIAEKDGRTTIVQAKRYQRPVGNKAVQEVIAARSFYKGDEAWVVTNSTFTPSAVALAQSAGVRLVDGVELGKLGRQGTNS